MVAVRSSHATYEERLKAFGITPNDISYSSIVYGVVVLSDYSEVEGVMISAKRGAFCDKIYRVGKKCVSEISNFTIGPHNQHNSRVVLGDVIYRDGYRRTKSVISIFHRPPNLDLQVNLDRIPSDRIHKIIVYPSDTPVCPNCERAYPLGWKYCPHDGTQLARRSAQESLSSPAAR
jgi:hypothetical protein